MPPGKPKIKTAVLTLRVDPVVKQLAEIAAKQDHRSVTSLIEVIILKTCYNVGIKITSGKKTGA
jgi:predicted HicB family RNase H-like nuclease